MASLWVAAFSMFQTNLLKAPELKKNVGKQNNEVKVKYIGIRGAMAVEIVSSTIL